MVDRPLVKKSVCPSCKYHRKWIEDGSCDDRRIGNLYYYCDINGQGGGSVYFERADGNNDPHFEHENNQKSWWPFYMSEITSNQIPKECPYQLEHTIAEPRMKTYYLVMCDGDVIGMPKLTHEDAEKDIEQKLMKYPMKIFFIDKVYTNENTFKEKYGI